MEENRLPPRRRLRDRHRHRHRQDLVSAILARAWNADYWKPVQTGVAEEPGDTDTVAGLAQLPPERLHLPAYVLQAPLSPWAAAPLEDAELDATTIVPPDTDAPLIVEGAGGWPCRSMTGT